MTDVEYTLKCVLASPNDDLARLAHADALEEAGQLDMADFIRVELEIANTAEHPVDELSVHDYFLYEKRQAIWKELGMSEWWDDLCNCAVYHRRGFIYRVVPNSLDNWLLYGPKIIRAHPVEEVYLLDKSPRELSDMHYGWWKGKVQIVSKENIPEMLWKALENPYRINGWWKIYQTRAEAMRAMSDALLKIVNGECT